MSVANGQPASKSRGLIYLAVGLALILALTAPFYCSTYMVRVLQLFLMYVGLATAWNILGGFSGYWSFGHTVYIGIGAFTAGKMAASFGAALPGGWFMAVAMLTGGLLSGTLALLLAYPLLRVRGIYFAIAMLGVGELTSELSSNVDAIGGAMGLMTPNVSPSNMDPAVFYYYIFLALAGLTLIIAAWIKNSRLGYGLISIREDEDTAKMLGVPTERYKIMTSVISASLVGVIGAGYGFALGYFTTPSVFRIDFSLNMILHCLIGGIGTLTGPIIGAGIMVFLTQVVLGDLLDVHVLITGLLVIAIVLLAPKGLIGTVGDWLKKRKVERLSEAEPDD